MASGESQREVGLGPVTQEVGVDCRRTTTDLRKIFTRLRVIEAWNAHNHKIKCGNALGLGPESWAAAGEGLRRSYMSKRAASGAQPAHALSASHRLLTDWRPTA